MNVLHLNDSINRGGAEIQVLDVCRNAADFDLQVTFVTLSGGALEDEFRASGSEFIKLRRRLPLDFSVILKLRRIIRERGIRIVHGYQAVDGLHLYLATLGLPVKRVLSFQGFVPDKKNRQALRYLIPRMDANIVVSRGLMDFHRESDNLDTRNFEVVYNGTDPARLRSSGKSIRRELGLGENVLLIGMIGNFYRDARKDQMTVCKSLPVVFAAAENVHCIFAGKVEAGAEAKFAECEEFCQSSGISEQVHFLGERRDVPDILDSLDLFVFSSIHEGLPLAMTEAMLSQTPLIISDIKPLLEASDGGRRAEVFRLGDSAQLSGKILDLLKNESKRNELAQNAFEFAMQNFTIEAHLRSLKKVYDSVLSK
jgi:glycosyltransferase involved in cell wall biosynthesis